MYTLDVMPRKKWSGASFSKRLLALRKSRGLTQTELAEAIESTQRAICYYETEDRYPPAPVVAKIAQALGVTTDEMLGVAHLKGEEVVSPEERRLWKKFRLILELPDRDQKAVIRLISSLVRNGEQQPA